MKRFWRRSSSRPTMAVPPALWPEYEYDPAAYPVSLNPASAVSRWFTGGGGGSAFLAVSAGADAPLWARSIPGAVSQTPTRAARARRLPRSEEHTSELQSRLHLVCRLLLEKKKQTKCIQYGHCDRTRYALGGLVRLVSSARAGRVS